jgi:hypothetical protein
MNFDGLTNNNEIIWNFSERGGGSKGFGPKI